MYDIKITDNTDYWDFAIDDNGDLQGDDSFASDIYISLLTDARADESEVLIPKKRRGWWGNLFNVTAGYQIGSKLWVLGQSRNTTETLEDAKDYARNCLRWIVDDGFCNRIAVSGKRTTDNIEIAINIYITSTEVESYAIKLWRNT